MLPSDLVAGWLAERGHLWQMALLDASGLESFAGRRGVEISSTQVVAQLWQIGLLRADLVESAEPLSIEGFTLVGHQAAGTLFYADQRTPLRRPRGWLNALLDTPPIPGTLKPSFHSFRYFVLYQIDRVLHWGTHRAQPLLDVDGIQRILAWRLPELEKWTASTELAERVTYWNDLVALAVAAEPLSYAMIYRHLRYAPWLKVEDFEGEIARHGDELAQHLATLPLAHLTHGINSLCKAAHSLDSNIDVHRLLRLADGELRLKLEGCLGGAMLLLAMAESIRRITEEAHAELLPEEDETEGGFIPGAKELTLGGRRIFDGDRSVALQLVRRYRLDYSLRLRWYVEGDTEIGAIRALFPKDRSTGIEVLNLRAHVHAGKGALAFRDELDADIRNAVYSFVSVDGDVGLNAKVARTAARQDRICGAFFIPTVDFESDNFAEAELQEIAWAWAVDEGAKHEQHELLSAEIDHQAPQKGGDIITTAARVLLLPQLRKSEEWGRRLASYALDHRLDSNGRVRPFIHGIQMAAHCDIANYQLTRALYRVNPTTSQPMRRDGTPE